jgi:hypothetical protein
MTRAALRYGRFVLAGMLAAGMVQGLMAQAAAAAPPPASAAKAKELVALMTSQKLEAFAVRESPIGDRFIAVMLVPNVQMLVVSAVYSRPTDIEYRIYQKDYVTAYRDLKTGALASDHLVVDDVLCDGLVERPAKNALPDTVTVQKTRQVFDGPADPKKRNDTRMPADVYAKAFADADQRYTKMLDRLIEELKKSGTLVPAGLLR